MRFYPNFQQNVSSGADNKSVTSADHESVSQGLQLQGSLNLGYYTAEFNQIFTKMLLLVLITKVSHELTLKIKVEVTI